MAVQRLAGWADEIMPSLEQIGQSVKHLINPNYDIQQELKKHIAANPQLLQEMIDNENLNPGSTSKTFGSQTEDLVRGRQSSAKAQVEQSTRDTLSSGRTTKDLVNDKSALGQATTRSITGTTQAGNRSQEASATVEENAARKAPEQTDYDLEQLRKNFPLIDVKAKADKATLDNSIKQAEVTAKNIGDALDAQPQLKGIKSNALAKKFVNDPESMTPQEQAQANMLTTNEGTKHLWDQQVQNFQHIRQLDTEAGWHTSADKATDRQIRAQAFTMVNGMNMPGNINAAVAYLSDPQVAAKAQAMAKGQLKPETNFDNDLVEIEKGLAQKQDMKYVVPKTHAYANIQSALKAIKTAKASDRPAIEAQINSDLQTIQQINGGTSDPITFRYDDKDFRPDSWGLYQVDAKTGKEKKLSDNEFGQITFGKPEASKEKTSGGTSGDTGNTKTLGAGGDPDAEALSAWRGMDPTKREEALKKYDAATQARIRTLLAKPR